MLLVGESIEHSFEIILYDVLVRVEQYVCPNDFIVAKMKILDNFNRTHDNF